MSLGLSGELVFVNQQTKEKIKVPAVAVYRKRQLNSATSQRFAICAYFAHIDEIGYWDEVQKRISSEKALEAAKWLAVSFRLSDTSVSRTFEQEVVSLLATNGEPTDFAQKRIRRVRLDEWARGWMFDLCYEPFQGLQNSAKKILQLNENGAIVLEDEDMLLNWLRERSKIYGHGEYQSSLSVPHEIYHSVHGQNKNITITNEINVEEPVIDILNLEGIKEPPIEIATILSSSIPDNEKTSIESIKSLNELPSHIGVGVNVDVTAVDMKATAAPVGGDVKPTEQIIQSGSIDGKSPVVVDVELSEGAIFLDPKMSSFEALAVFSAEQIRRGVVRAPAQEFDFGKSNLHPVEGKNVKNNGASGEKATTEVVPGTVQSKDIINFDIVRLPLPTSDRVNWNEALYMPTKFVAKEHFDLLKYHWKASIGGEDGGKAQSLYSIDALMALSSKGVEYSVNGCAPLERHISAQTRQIDPERLTLYALSKAPNWEMGFVVSQHAASLVYERTLQSIALQQKNISNDVKENSVLWEKVRSARIGSGGNCAMKIGKILDKRVIMVPNFQADGFSVFELDSISEIKCLKLCTQLKEVYENVKGYPYINISKNLASNFLDDLTKETCSGKIVMRERFYGKNNSSMASNVDAKTPKNNYPAKRSMSI